MQKNVVKGFPSWLERIEVPKKGGVVNYPLANDQRSKQYGTNEYMHNTTYCFERWSLASGWLTTPPFFGTSTRSSHAGKPFETSFCMKPVLPMPDGIALHRHRPAADVGQHHRRYRLIVGGELALRDPVVGEEHLLGMADRRDGEDGAGSRHLSHHFERRLVGAHAQQPRVAQLAVVRPLDEGDLDDDLRPHPVHAERGRPSPFVNGVVGISRASRRRRRSRSSAVSKPVPTLPAKTKSSPS